MIDFQDPNLIGQVAYWALLVFGLVAVSGAIFFFVFKNYSHFETQIMKGISGYADEIYRLFDLMFNRKSMNYCYLLILIPTIVMTMIGAVVGLQIGLLWIVVFAAGFGFIGFKVPGAVVRFLFSRRLAKFEAQLVDALNMMSNAIKSGLSFMQVVQLLEQELENPASEEFGMVLKENRVGTNLNDALINMTNRVPSDDLFMIMNSVVTLSQQGGDISEAFDKIAWTIRERQRVQQKIRTLAQAGMTQATILSAFPFVMMGIMYVIDPKQIMGMFTTAAGWVMIGIMLALISLGAVWMKKILTIEV